MPLIPTHNGVYWSECGKSKLWHFLWQYNKSSKPELGIGTPWFKLYFRIRGPLITTKPRVIFEYTWGR
jgi:hypothetical protein